MTLKSNRMASCHPNLKHYAHDLCHPCYLKTYFKIRKETGWKRNYKSEEGYELLKQRAAKWNKDNSERRYKQKCRMKWYKYGLTEEEYQKMYDAQRGLCALGCGKEVTCIDHCHASGKLRKLLCRNCNLALGFFMDDPELMRRAAIYIEFFSEENANVNTAS